MSSTSSGAPRLVSALAGTVQVAPARTCRSGPKLGDGVLLTVDCYAAMADAVSEVFRRPQVSRGPTRGGVGEYDGELGSFLSRRSRPRRSRLALWLSMSDSHLKHGCRCRTDDHQPRRCARSHSRRAGPASRRGAKGRSPAWREQNAPGRGCSRSIDPRGLKVRSRTRRELHRPPPAGIAWRRKRSLRVARTASTRRNSMHRCSAGPALGRGTLARATCRREATTKTVQAGPYGDQAKEFQAAFGDANPYCAGPSRSTRTTTSLEEQRLPQRDLRARGRSGRRAPGARPGQPRGRRETTPRAYRSGSTTSRRLMGLKPLRRRCRRVARRSTLPCSRTPGCRSPRGRRRRTS